ncbi:MAG TPA: squalene/phytoene synthase family protein [Steroidobacteraceae bacterium]
MSRLDDSLVNRAAPAGSMRYFSLLYAPEDKRDRLCALYVIDAEIRESAQSANHDVAHTRLTWWRAEIDRLVNGNPQHPATRLLNESQPVDRLSCAKLHEAVAAADMDLARMTYSNMRELRAYCSRSGGAIQELMAAQLVGPAALDEGNRATANRLGIGVRQAEILRDLRQDCCDGRVYLPQDRLTAHEVTLEDLRNREIAPRLRAALREYRNEVQEELQSAVAASSAQLRPLAVLAALHRRLLDRIASSNYDVATARVELGPIEKPWVAWRTARKL